MDFYANEKAVEERLEGLLEQAQRIPHFKLDSRTAHTIKSAGALLKDLRANPTTARMASTLVTIGELGAIVWMLHRRQYSHTLDRTYDRHKTIARAYYRRVSKGEDERAAKRATREEFDISRNTLRAIIDDFASVAMVDDRLNTDFFEQ